MAFVGLFFYAVDYQRNRSMQKENAAIQTEIQYCSSKIGQNGDTRDQKMYNNKKHIWTKVVSDSRKNGNSTNFFGVQALRWENDSNYNFL